MTWPVLLGFMVLAIIANTSIPLTFEPILLYFVAGKGLATGCAFALAGGVSAGVGASVDAFLLRKVKRLASPSLLARVPELEGLRLYAFAFLFALPPLPFTLVRVSLLRARHRALLYAVAVAAGRLPRYVVTVYACRILNLPAWVGVIAFAAALAGVVAACARSRRDREPLQESVGSSALDAVRRGGDH